MIHAASTDSQAGNDAFMLKGLHDLYFAIKMFQVRRIIIDDLYRYAQSRMNVVSQVDARHAPLFQRRKQSKLSEICSLVKLIFRFVKNGIHTLSTPFPS